METQKLMIVNTKKSSLHKYLSRISYFSSFVKRVNPIAAQTSKVINIVIVTRAFAWWFRMESCYTILTKKRGIM